MHKPPIHHDDPYLITFSDIVTILKKNKSTLLKGALVMAVLALSFGLFRPVHYLAEGTFKEKGKAQSGIGKSISEFFFSADSHESDASTIMKSRRLTEDLVKTLGLQASIEKEEHKFPFLPLGNIKDNLLTEYALFKNKRTPALNDPTADLVAVTVVYEQEVPHTLRLIAGADNRYTLMQGRSFVGEGHFDVPFYGDAFALLLRKNTKHLIEGNVYLITLNPLGETAKNISKDFVIEPDKNDKSLLKITFKHRVRHQAALYVNTLMELYQDYVSNEHQRITGLQVDYLLQRQKEMANQLEQAMEAHAQKLSSDLFTTGFATSEKAMDFLAHTQQSLKQKMMSIDLDIQRLESLEGGGPLNIDNFSSFPHPDIINKMTTEIRSLKQQADAFNLAINRNTEERPAERKIPLSEFQGINSHTAMDLYIAYSKELSDVESQSIQQRFLISQIHEPSFEITSLSTVLKDPISTEMISKASNHVLALKDHDNRSLKEQERLKVDLDIQRNFLISHLEQADLILDLRQKFLKDKIQRLQSMNLSLIEEQILILENQLKDYVSSAIVNLKQEQALLEKNLAELRSEMAAFPQKWAAEHLIEQQMEINQNMVEEISKLVESKNISNNLEKIQSTPIDLPLIPLHPKSPRLFLLTMIGGILGYLLSFVWVLARSLKTGVEASQDSIRNAGQHVSGTLSRHLNHPILDRDLETLRRLLTFMTSNTSDSTFSSSSHMLLLLENQGPDYSIMLAELMSKMQLKVLVIDLGFDDPESRHLPGMLQFLKGEVPKPLIFKEEGIDRIASGGISRFSHELIASESFRDFLFALRQEYEWILIASNASPVSAEGASLLDLFPEAAMTLCGESMEQLRPCIQLSKNPERQRRLSFIFL